MVGLFLNIFYFFGIDDALLLKQYNKILDCPSGSSSFVFEANRLGIKAVGRDPLFGASLKTLVKKGTEDINRVIEIVQSVPQLYNWHFYKSIEGLREYRTRALRGFISDYHKGLSEKRYIKGSMPKLPFRDKTFDIVLSGHFLFTYAYRFDFDFHLPSILELFRVSNKEVRIYPLQQGIIAQPYKQMTKLLNSLRNLGIDYEIRKVRFEFQKGSGKVLCLKH
ncbi:MAG TPA: hypothetical protein VE130_12725 [Nitrososphaeraceae archaeon]|nr:hypothetical protein [Nitrososphaeraceae archaeon]